MPADFRSQVFQGLLNAWDLILYLAPYLIGGILASALMNTFLPKDFAMKLLGKKKWWVMPLAGLAGMASPACTYGTVPIFMQLLSQGAPVSSAVAFLVSSAMVNPQMFVLISGALGVRVAVAQAVASFAFAMIVGAAADRLPRGFLQIQDSCEGESCSHKRHSRDSHAPKWRVFLDTSVNLFEFAGFFFVFGAMLAGVLAEFIPSEQIFLAVGEGKWWAVPLAAFASIPVYVCGGGTIPLVAQASAKGMSGAAVIAFLIAGPATRITSLSALGVFFRKRAVAIYVLIVVLFSCVFGLAASQFADPIPKPETAPWVEPY